MSHDSDRGFMHVLNHGEDIWLLAELYYGAASLWWVIYHANLEVFGDDPEFTVPGTELFIPYLEVSETDEELPGFITQVAAEPSYDPLLLIARDHYGDQFMVFDLYEFNKWDEDRVPGKGERIRYPARASKPAMRRAERWRCIFYRG